MKKLPPHYHVFGEDMRYSIDRHEIHFEEPFEAEKLRELGIQSTYKGPVQTIVILERRREKAYPLRVIPHHREPIESEEIRLYATRWDESTDEVPQSVEVVKQERKRQSTIEKILNNSPRTFRTSQTNPYMN